MATMIPNLARAQAVAAHGPAERPAESPASVPAAAQKRISVIVANRNYGLWLGETIDSVLCQDYPNKELIVVDTDSNDSSRAVIESYGDRLKALYLTIRGQGVGINAGFASATGDIVIFLDSDDLLAPGALTAIATAFEPGTAHVSWTLRHIDEHGRKLGQVWPEEPLPRGLSPLDGYRKWGAIYAPPHSGNAYVRPFLETVMPLEPPYTKPGVSPADGYFIIMSWLFGKSKHLTDELGFYRIHGSNLSGIAKRASLKVVETELLFAEDKDRRLKERADVIGLKIAPDEGVSRSVRYQKLRLYAARLGRDTSGTAAIPLSSVLKDGLRAAFSASNKPFATRLKYVAFFALFAIMPASLLEEFGPDLFSDQGRRVLYSSLGDWVRQVWRPAVD